MAPKKFTASPKLFWRTNLDLQKCGQNWIPFFGGLSWSYTMHPSMWLFLDSEIARLSKTQGAAAQHLEDFCEITDSLAVARHKHPGQKNSLDALCRRYMVDNSQRQLHGALLDAEILADVYLLMTGGQAQMFSGGSSQDGELAGADEEQKAVLDVSGLKVISPVPEELEAHEAMLSLMDQHSGGQTLWRR